LADFFFEFGYFFIGNPNLLFGLLKISPKISYLIYKLATQKHSCKKMKKEKFSHLAQENAL